MYYQKTIYRIETGEPLEHFHGTGDGSHIIINPEDEGVLAIFEGLLNFDTEYVDKNTKTVKTKEKAEPILTYMDKRSLEYPALVEQVEALMKGGQYLTDMKQRIETVKLKYPKE